MTRIWSALRIVLSRWAMTKLVRLAISRSSASWMSFSVRRIHAGGGFVQNQNRRVLQQGARDADALLFADAQLHAAFADSRIVILAAAAR